jgi:hypothetical protein
VPIEGVVDAHPLEVQEKAAIGSDEMAIVEVASGKYKLFDDTFYDNQLTWEAKAAAVVYWPSGQPTEIVNHFAATSWDCSAAEINQWHKDRGFIPRGSGPHPYMGYHYLVRMDGTHEVGRTLDVIGTHCLGHNYTALGVCYSGGLNPDGTLASPDVWPTREQYITGANLHLDLLDDFGSLSIGRIFLHRELNSTNCPGNFSKVKLLEIIDEGGMLPMLEVTQHHFRIEDGFYLGLVVVDAMKTLQSCEFEIEFPEECNFVVPPKLFPSPASGENYGAIVGMRDVSKDKATLTLVEKADVWEDSAGNIHVVQPMLDHVGIALLAFR